MSSETLLLLVRLGFSLSLVFGLMWVAARVMRGKGGGTRRAKTSHLEIIERKALTKNSSIAIVRVADQTLTVGITDAGVSLLGPADIDLDALDAADAEVGAQVTATIAPPIPLRSADAVPTSAPLPSVSSTASGRRSFLDSLRDKTVRHVAG